MDDKRFKRQLLSILCVAACLLLKFPEHGSKIFLATGRIKL